jgi:hypothetical protein
VATSTLAKPRSPTSSIPESFREHNARSIDDLRRAGDQLLAQSGFLSPDPLKIALSGFPDVNPYRAYYEGAGNDVE